VLYGIEEDPLPKAILPITEEGLQTKLERLRSSEPGSLVPQSHRTTGRRAELRAGVQFLNTEAWATIFGPRQGPSPSIGGKVSHTVKAHSRLRYSQRRDAADTCRSSSSLTETSEPRPRCRVCGPLSQAVDLEVPCVSRSAPRAWSSKL
jgi:hypothetical protein